MAKLSATISKAGKSATVTWLDGKIALEKPTAELAAQLAAILHPNSITFFNPLRGGYYRGFDPAIGLEVRDALLFLKRSGFAVEFTATDLPELKKEIPAAIVPANVDEEIAKLGSAVDRHFEVDDA
jgi:hypothetical protein